MKIQQRKYFPLIVLMLYISFTPLFQALYCKSCNKCIEKDPCLSCCEVSKSKNHCKVNRCSEDVKLYFERGKCDCQFTNMMTITLFKVNNDFNFSIIKNSVKQIDYNLEVNKIIPSDLIIHYSYNPIFILNSSFLI
ncbi:MAG: hypothetical protein JXA68_07050 [Ignavibacteriales bacterium]|nr:hypothetical protein [Ignavibacteriales bacterium]